VPTPPEQAVVVVTTEQRIVPQAALKNVVTAPQPVAVDATRNCIFAPFTLQLIVSVLTVAIVVTKPTIDPVISGAALDDVIPGTASQQIIVDFDITTAVVHQGLLKPD